MHNSIKNKKGVELAFGIIIGVVILLLSVVVIVWVIKDSASKADEKTQVELCRVSNEIKQGIDRRTGTVTDILLGPAPRICSTIPKIKEKFRVPIKMYPQDKGGAEAEIREMIKNCWYMWLEGSEPNMFDKTFGSDCFVCYKFLIKDLDEDVNFMSLAESMTEPFFVEDASDKCAPVGGFFIDEAESCEEDYHILGGVGADEWRGIPSEKAASEDEPKKCCISKNAANECENKGGMCSEEGTSGDYNKIYYKWYCPKAKQRCYVKEEHMFSYVRYITEYGRMGGDVYFISPIEVERDDIGLVQPPEGEEAPPPQVQVDPDMITYPTGNTYAISFISPSEQFCETDQSTLGCLASVGGKLAIGSLSDVALGGIMGFALTGKSTIFVGVGLAAAGLEGIAGKIPGVGGMLKRGLHKIAGFFLGSVTEPVPSFMIVSTLEVSNHFGCKVGLAS
jgi:hypothetical protein